MFSQNFLVVIGKMWTDAHPRETLQPKQIFDLRPFDILNAAQSIRELEGVIVHATIIRLEWLDSISPYIRALEDNGTPVLHVIVSEQKKSNFPIERLNEIGVCGIITETEDVHHVATDVTRIIDTCSCKPGDSAFSKKSASLARAFERVDADEVDKRIITLVSEGFSNEEIARAISFSAKTVRNHLSEIMKSTGTHNRTELALAWRRFSVDKDLRATRY